LLTENWPEILLLLGATTQENRKDIFMPRVFTPKRISIHSVSAHCNANIPTRKTPATAVKAKSVGAVG
jgi:hypothetical protein